MPKPTPAAETIGGGVDNSLPPLSEDMEVTERLLPKTEDSNGKLQLIIGPTDLHIMAERAKIFGATCLTQHSIQNGHFL